jgi:hypothetical protein
MVAMSPAVRLVDAGAAVPAASSGHPAAAYVAAGVAYANVSRSGPGTSSEQVHVGPGSTLSQLVTLFDETPPLGGVTCDLVLADPPTVSFPATATSSAIVAALPGCSRISVSISGKGSMTLADEEGSQSGQFGQLVNQILSSSGGVGPQPVGPQPPIIILPNEPAN